LFSLPIRLSRGLNINMSDAPKYSILIPTSGRMNLMRMAIKSVLEQSYKDFELVIANSGAKNLGNEIKQISESIRYYNIHEESKGLPLLPFDFSVKKARGEYMLWLDDDNYLLPQALEIFDQIAKKSSADILTATHLYYYDDNHPQPKMRNCLGIIPFSGKEEAFNPKEILRVLYSFSRENIPRFHTSAMMFSRAVVERAVKKIGSVILTDQPNAMSLHPILLSSARSAYFIDKPVVIIGRLGRSMSQNWAIAARKRFAKEDFKLSLSPLSGYTRINATLENYLQVKKIMSEEFSDIEIDYEKFAPIYLKELLYLDSSLKTLKKNWDNVFEFLNMLKPKTKKLLLPKAKQMRNKAIIVYFARRTGLNFLKRRFYGAFKNAGNNKKTPAKKFKGGREFEIPVKKYGASSIETLAEKLPKIMYEELNIEL